MFCQQTNTTYKVQIRIPDKKNTGTVVETVPVQYVACQKPIYILNNTTDNHQSFSVCFGCCVHIERNKIADHHTLSIFRIPHLITF